jgi:hypothetical protein
VESKREHALALPRKRRSRTPVSRFVFVENVLRQPIEIAGGAGLDAMQLAGQRTPRLTFRR